MLENIRNWKNKNEYIQDMSFLGAIVWPKIINDQIAHDSYHCEKYPNARSFPTRRFSLEHCGGVFDEFDIPRQGDMDILRGKLSPMACRRKPDWVMG